MENLLEPITSTEVYTYFSYVLLLIQLIILILFYFFHNGYFNLYSLLRFYVDRNDLLQNDFNEIILLFIVCEEYLMKYFILFLIFMCFCFICHEVNHFLSIFHVFLRFLSFCSRSELLLSLCYFSLCADFYAFGNFYRIYDLNFDEADNDYDNCYHLYLKENILFFFA